MSNRNRLFAAAGLLGCLTGGPARADGTIEKPPGVPPEVEAARTACPTLHGPCYGFYPTRWRVLSDCCVPPPPAAGLPSRAPAEIPPAAKMRATPDKAPAKKPEAKPTKPESKPKLEPAAAYNVVIPPAPRPAPPVEGVPDVAVPSPPARPVWVEVVPDGAKSRR
jgi:hypothetical protein